MKIRYLSLIVLLVMRVFAPIQAQPKALFDKTTHEFGTILWKNYQHYAEKFYDLIKLNLSLIHI